jgi:hypothetical protein
MENMEWIEYGEGRQPVTMRDESGRAPVSWGTV